MDDEDDDNELLQMEVQMLEDDLRHMKFIIKSILNDLPVKRDWLNPETEKMARDAVKE